MPTRSELALSDDNSEVGVFLSGASAYAAASSYNGSSAATVTSNDVTNYGSVGLTAFIDVTVISGAPIVIPEIQGKDSTSGKYYTILSGAGFSTATTQKLSIHPAYVSGGLVVFGSAGARSEYRDNIVLPRVFRLKVTHASGASTAATYTMS